MEISYMELQIKALNGVFLKVKKRLKTDQEKDEEKIKFLSNICFNTTQYLENLNRKGKHILNISRTCKKFETEREKLSCYIPVKKLETEKEKAADKEITQTGALDYEVEGGR